MSSQDQVCRFSDWVVDVFSILRNFFFIIVFLFHFILFYGYIVGSLLNAGWSYFITTLGKLIIYAIIKLDNIINIILNSDILS